MLVELEDGGVLNVEESGRGYPLILLHGGPGLDHHQLRPWLDPLAEAGLRLLFVDMRGQGGSPRVDPATLEIGVFARDVDRLARALDLTDYALLGTSFGAIVALSHALQQGSASHYVLVAPAASIARTMEDVEREIDRFEPAWMRDQIRRSWAAEATVESLEQARSVMESQMPFHFYEMGDAYRAYMERDEIVYAPEVLARFARDGYGDFDWTDGLRWISRPALVVVGRHDRVCTPDQAREIADEVPDSSLVVLERAGHMPFVEQPAAFLAAVRRWLTDQGVIGEPAAAAPEGASG